MERVLLPNASAVAKHGPALVACFGTPVGIFLIYDAFFKAGRVNHEELEWKRREVQRASVKLREVVKLERTKYYLNKLGAGGQGTVRLTFTLNVGGYGERALREELQRLFEVDSCRLLLVEDTLDEDERESGERTEEMVSTDGGTQPEAPPKQLVRTNSVQVLVAKLTAQLKDQLIKKGAKISQAFHMMDRNGEGTISADNFALGLADVGLDMRPDDIAALVASIDRDGDGQISLHEWTIAFGPRQITVAILPERGDNGKVASGENADETKGDDPDVIARQLKKKLTKLGKSSGSDVDSYPLLSTVETQVSPVQTEVNELKWTEAKRIYTWRKEASHMRFRDVEITQNAAELQRKDVALGKAAVSLEEKVALLRRERDEVDALLLAATQLTWKSLQREVSECVTKMNDSTHTEHEKFRDGKAIKDLLHLVRRERKRMVRVKYGKGPRAFAVRHLDYYGLIDRSKWCSALKVGPTREELVTAVNALRAKKKEQYGKLGVLLRLASSSAPTLFAGTVFNTLSGAVTPLTLKFKSDMIRSLQQLDYEQVYNSFWSVIYVQFITMFIDNLSNRFTRRGADAVSQTLKRMVGKAIISQDLRYFDSVDKPNRCLRDAEDIEHDLVYQPQSVIKRAVGLVSNFIVAYEQSPDLLKLMAVILPVTNVVQALVINWFRKSTRRQQRGRMRNDDSLGMESVTHDSESMQVVRSFGRELRTVEEFSASNEVQDDLQQQSDLLLDLLNPIFRFSYQIGTYLGLYFGSRLVLQNKMSATDVAISVSLSENLVHGVKSFFQRELPGLARVLAPATRIIEMLDRTPTQGIDEKIGLTPTKPLNGVIEFKDVHFAYPRDKNKKVLRGLSFKLDAGESLGIVGSAGCGKSTALRVLLRMYDCQSGQVLIDGRDIRDYNPPWLRRQMAVVQQTPYIIDGDIRANLVYGYAGSAGGRNEDPTQEEIEAACKRTNAYKVIMEQPERWRTDCSDLSPGQKQIITITRALLRNPRILILDEITASLDADTQELIATAIETLMEGRTTVQIAHRLVVLQNSNHIICMEDGVVAQSGDHKSLMTIKDGMYRRMVLKQNLNTGSDGEDQESDCVSNCSEQVNSSDASDGSDVSESSSDSEDDADDSDAETEEVTPKDRVMAASNGENSGVEIETEDLLLELSVLGKDLSSGAALKDERAVAEFQATASSLVERASMLVQRVSREQARLEQLAMQVDRPPTTVISPSVAVGAAAAAAAAPTDTSEGMSEPSSGPTEDVADGGLGLSRQLSRTRSRSGL